MRVLAVRARAIATRQFGCGETVVGSFASVVDDGFEVASYTRSGRTGNTYFKPLWREA